MIDIGKLFRGKEPIKCSVVTTYKCRLCDKIINGESKQIKLVRTQSQTALVNDIIDEVIKNDQIVELFYGHEVGWKPQMAISHICNDDTIGICELQSIKILKINDVKPNLNETTDALLRLCGGK
jgi:hypothetical protein